MLLPELQLRRDKIRWLMSQQKIDAALIACNVNLLYTNGSVVNGYMYLPLNAPATLFVKRPNNIKGMHVEYIHKPEEITEILQEKGIQLPATLMLEGDELSYNEYTHLASLFPESTIVNGTPILHQARSIKTPYEIEMIRRSAVAHAKAYAQIPSVFKVGMTDRELSIEIEKLMRQEGNLGIFRICGHSMETFMGSLLAGDNAAAPSPYDFALGGQGCDPTLPAGVNGTKLSEGMSVMVDMGGNFHGYMEDMTRVFSVGKLSKKAYDAHQICLDIQNEVSSMAVPGAVCEDLYNKAVEIAEKSGFGDYFMGSIQKAKFIGHGIGLEINEMPVFAQHMKQELEPGMVYALEPKIIVPETGAVGIENTWVVTKESSEKLTLFNEEIIDLTSPVTEA